ncbi:GyrI-like domain-containing protein [Cytobacillus sp. FSL W7-1323]|uniref:GyrI-like domain-containing protein n=1 Tax=Cytobacillus TaxID=2675230 RepID=UPI0025A021B3|nr:MULTISPECIES: GyrI-like domain-containing protein [Cytobacillus]MDM5209794.1 GyrI-like domain-containing protein [Cytobacillus kochii]MDQ0188168.1 putative transcriptional regulator YdeE [Cytobacillus kochii]MEA1853926.1 GyrI-like domain-containing protein [Cytobacillus sp. OWB-43]
MANYSLQEKEGFVVLGFGIEIVADYRDQESINQQKSDFWETVKKDGTLEQLQSVADNNYIFAVNEAVNNKMMHYAGVMTEKTLPDATRIIQFPKGPYLVVEGKADSAQELSNQLTAVAFGQALVEMTDYAYVGGPNTTVEMSEDNGTVYGEMWIPVVKK